MIRVFGIGLALVAGCVAVGVALSVSHDAARSGPRLKDLQKETAGIPDAERAQPALASRTASTPASLAELTRQLQSREAALSKPAAPALTGQTPLSVPALRMGQVDEPIAQPPIAEPNPEVEPLPAAFGPIAPLPLPPANPETTVAAPEHGSLTLSVPPAPQPLTSATPAPSSALKGEIIVETDRASPAAEKLRTDNYLIGVFR
jgi:hypothetical protein